MTAPAPPNPQTAWAVRAALIGSVALALLALAAFWFVSTMPRRAPTGVEQGVTVTVSDTSCAPNALSTPAGRTTFTIVNRSTRAVEWEILDGVMVVDERENIAPGLSQTLTANLAPGRYEITCGLLSNPRGTLLVTPSAASNAEATRPPTAAFVGALAEYQVYLGLQAETLDENVQALKQATQAEDLAAARTHFGAVQLAYASIEPVVMSYADLDARLNARAEYLALREKDPAFVGLGRIEYGLFVDNDVRSLQAPSARLQADVALLKTRLSELDMQPAQLADSATRALRRVADRLADPRSAAYRGAEAAGLEGTLEGTRKIADLLGPLLAAANPELKADLAAKLAAFDAALAPLRHGQDFVTGGLPQTQRQRLADLVRGASDDFSKINAALGLQ